MVRVVVKQKTVGMLYAPGAGEPAPLELLAQAAALQLEALRAGPRPALVSIRSLPRTWTELRPEDQELHLRAQRFARVQSAAMRLYAAAQVNEGRAQRDLDSSLNQYLDS